MASQYLRVTGNPAGRAKTSNAILQSKIARLPQAMAAKQAREQIARDKKFQKQNIQMAKKDMKFRERQEESAMGLEASKLGLNLAMSDMGSKTLGDVGTGAKAAYRGVRDKFAKPGTNEKLNVEDKDPSMVSKLPIGAALSSGLTGYGVGKLVGGKSKGKKALYGGGAGALMGMMSAPKGSGLGGMMAGGLTGALGGYFS